MNKEFIPYELAVKLKALGFDEPCLRVGNPNGHTMWKWIEVDKDNETISVNDILNVEYMEVYIQIPTFSQSFRFFREKYNLVHEISWGKYKGGVSFDYDVFSLVLPTDDELGDEDDIYIEKPMETYDSLAGKSFRDRESDTFEEAELAAIVKLIEICKNK